MKIKAKIQGIRRDVLSGRWNITFQMEEGNINAFEQFIEKPLTVEVKKYSAPRTNDANRLLWACLGELANYRNVGNEDVYIEMLRKYGQFTYSWVARECYEAFKTQWRLVEITRKRRMRKTNGYEVLCYFGSSTYSKKEFTRLLDGVIQEMINDGLNPPTSQEMQRSLEKWEQSQ